MTETAWEGDLAENVREIDRPHTVDPEQGRIAWSDTVLALGDLLEAARALAKAAPDGAAQKISELEHVHVVTLIAALQDVRRDLAQVEAWLAREVGRDEMATREGVLADGRHFTVRRGTSRKAWDHETWQHDARARVCDEMVGGYKAVDPDTGETIDLLALLACVQRVHGSAGPRVTALKHLGLRPDDYCETVPGSWSVQVSAPGQESSSED